MNQAYRLIWNERLAVWSVVPEIASARGKRGRIQRAAGAALLSILIGSHASLAADLAVTALPGGGQVTAGQAAISTSGTRMDINQGSQRAIINWQNFDIGSQAQVNFAQPNAAAVALNRVSGPTASRIEGQLSANGQVFLVNPNGVLFGGGARVNVGALAVSTLNIRDDDFLGGNYLFTGTGGSITNQGQISAAPGGYLAFIAPSITNSGSVNAPQGKVAMGAGERVRLNFAGDRLVGLDVSASMIDTLISNSQAIRAEGGAILLTVAGAEAVTRSAINNTGVLEAGSLTRDGGRIVLNSGGDINLGSSSTVAVNGKNGGEITAQAQSGTILADGRVEARGDSGAGGTVRLLGKQAGLVGAAQVDASGATGGGTVLVGGDYQGRNPDVHNAQRTYVSSGASIKADAVEHGDGGKVVVWADGDTRYYGNISAQGGSRSGNGGLVEVSGKENLDFNGGINVGAAFGVGGRVLLDPQNIVLSPAVAAPPPNNPNGTPDIAFNDPPAVGTTNVQVSTVTGFSELFLQATNDITVNNPVTMGANNSIRLEANNNITLATGANVAVSGTGSINFKADADGNGAGTLAMNNATLTSNVGGITLSGASISGTGAITATGAGSANGGNVNITGTSAAGNVNLTGAITTTGGTAAANTPGRNAGNVTINGAGAVTTGAITANGSAGSGANRAGGNGGAINVTSNGALVTGALTANGGNGVATAAGGNAGTITVTNNSTTSGSLTTGTLTARAGAAAGAIVSGNSGSISVTNSAATLLRTGAINTSGQAGGAGGNVNLNSVGDVTVTGTILTSGAALVAGTTAAGRNAGNVTITGVNRSVTGAITASGAAGLGANQAGGNAGLVSITGSGALSSLGIAAQTGAATGTGSGGMVGGISLNGTSVSTGVGGLTTTGGANGNGGNISVTSTAGTLAVGAVSASGGTAITGTAGRNAGTVTLNSAGTVTATTIAANGTAGLGTNANQTGGNGAAISITGIGGVTTTAIGASGGAATTTNANGGNAGSITINNSGSGNISTTTLTASTGAARGTGAGGSQGFISVTNTAAGGNLTTTGITTTGGAKGNGGNVTLSALGAVSTTNSNITTSGGAGIGSAGSNAGYVTISGGGVNLGTGTLTANGGAGNGANRAGGRGAAVQITSTNGITANGAINATGGNGVAGIAAGGDAGSVNISNSGAGAVQTGAIVARNGVAFTTGAGGGVGSIAVTNTAGNVTLGALTTTGQANGDGGNINANAAGLLTLNGAIASSGGTNVAATTQAGKHAGSVTLSGYGGITTAAAATITASGSAGLGTNQAGGNAGVVSLTSSAGAISARAIASRTGAATGTGTGGSAGSITLNGASVTTNAGALNTTGGANGNGGNITATAGTGLLNVGAITASGGAANANTAGRNAGAVTLTGDSVTTLGITANGTIGNTSGAGGNGGNVSVTGTANAVSVGAISTIGGNGAGGNSAGGNAGTITLDAGATTPSITLGGNLTATGGNPVGTGAAGSGGQIWLKDAVLLNAAVTASAGGGNAGFGTGGDVRFDGTVNSTGGARALVANTNSATIFNGAVGGIAALTSLTTNAGGTTSIGGNVTTTVVQTYSDAVTLAGNAVLTGTTPTFASTVAGGGFDLTLNFSGTTTVNGANFTGIRNLATGNGGTTRLTGAITTSGTQTYSDAVTLTGATTLASGNTAITFNNTVNGGQTLTVNTTGTTTFAGAVGGTTALTSLTTNAGGTTSIGGNVTTTGAQTYNDAVTLTGGGTRTFASTGNAAIAFNTAVDGGSAMVVNTTGATTFAGTLGGTTALTSLTTNAGGTTSIGGNVTTTGVQTYNDAVTLTGNAILTGTTPTFGSTVAGGGNDLTLNFSATTTVNGANFTGIRNLATGNGGATQLTGAITTSGTQTYSDAVTLTGATTLASGNTAITFNNTVNGGQTLTVNTTGTTTFAGAVGGTTALTSLTTNAGGTTAINGGSVRTTGAQAYNDNVTLGAPTTLTTTNSTIVATGAVNAGGNTLSLAAGAGNVAMNNTNNDFGTVAVTSATNVGLADINAIDLGASTISGSLVVNAGGAITQSGALSVAGASSFSAGVNAITLGGANNFVGAVAFSNSGAANNVVINDISDLNLSASSAGGTLTATAGGTLTLSGSLTAGGAGNAINLSGGRFVNTAGAGALATPSGRWLVWSGNPNPFGGATPDNRGGLAYNFKQYNATFGSTTPAQSTGNGFLYSLAPTLTVSLTGTASKVYDGTTAATLAASNFTYSGSTVDGDVIVSVAGTGAYDNRNVGNAKTVTASAITATAANGSAVVYGYTLSPDPVSANIGAITPAPLTVTAQADNRVYNGTNSSAVAPVVTGTTYDAVGTNASQVYDNKNVGSGKTLTASGLLMNDGNSGANYAISYVANTSGVITPAALAINAVTDSKVYDGSTVSTAAPSIGALYGTDSVTGVNQSFASRNALGANGSLLNVTAYTINDGNGGLNYSVTSSSASGTITPAPLTVTAQADNRVYNGTNNSAVAPVVTGTTYDAVGTNASQVYDNKNVGSGKTLTASGLLMNDGNSGANYAISYVANTSGVITPAALAINAVTDSKVYDATTGSSGVVATTGLQGSDTVSSLSQSYASKNVLGANGSTLLVNGGYVVNDGNGGANYTVTTSTANGTIAPASLSITADDKSKLFGTPNPPFTATYAGFVGGETPADLGGTLSFQTTAVTTSPPGGYPITPFGQTSDNYAIAYVDGVLTIRGDSVGPVNPGETAADQQAIGAQYANPLFSASYASAIQYLSGDDDCSNANRNPERKCGGGGAQANGVRIVKQGIRLPQ